MGLCICNIRGVVTWALRRTLCAATCGIVEYNSYEDAIPKQPRPIVYAQAVINEVFESITKNAWIPTVGFLAMSHKAQKVLWWNLTSA
jgi:hypothetical protein